VRPILGAGGFPPSRIGSADGRFIGRARIDAAGAAVCVGVEVARRKAMAATAGSRLEQGGSDGGSRWQAQVCG